MGKLYSMKFPPHGKHISSSVGGQKTSFMPCKVFHVVFSFYCFYAFFCERHVSKNEYVLKTDQSDSKSTLIYFKWFQSDPKVCKTPPKWLQNRPGLLRCRPAPGSPSPLGQAKYVENMNIFCLWTCLGRTRSDMICITCAIRRLYAAFGIPFFTFRPFSSIILIKIVAKVTST